MINRALSRVSALVKFVKVSLSCFILVKDPQPCISILLKLDELGVIIILFLAVTVSTWTQFIIPKALCIIGKDLQR